MMQQARTQLYFLAVLLMFSLVLACGKPKVEAPPGLLTRQQMIPILVDVHIAQAAIGQYGVGDSSRFSMKDYLPYILYIHHVEEAVYDSSVSFYLKHPEIMEELYDEVIDELSRKQGEASAK